MRADAAFSPGKGVAGTEVRRVVHDGLAALASPIDAPNAATYGARIELGELVAAELRARAQQDADAILERLRPLAFDFRVSEDLAEHEVLRASFLVDRKKIAQFDGAMNEIARRQDGR